VRSLILRGFQTSVPQFVTIRAMIPGKILCFCLNCWHKPTTQEWSSIGATSDIGLDASVKGRRPE
jgi:hypothetical protein